MLIAIILHLATLLDLLQAFSTSTTNITTLLKWHVCVDEEYRDAGLDCAEFGVPIDWTVPDGPSLTLSMNRLKATKPDERIGSMIYNPGGPGESAMDIVLQFALNQTYLGDSVRSSFDTSQCTYKTFVSHQSILC